MTEGGVDFGQVYIKEASIHGCGILYRIFFNVCTI